MSFQYQSAPAGLYAWQNSGASSGPVRRLPNGIIWNSPGPGRAPIRLVPQNHLPSRPPLMLMRPTAGPFMIWGTPAAQSGGSPVFQPAVSSASSQTAAPAVSSVSSSPASTSAATSSTSGIMGFVKKIPVWGWALGGVGAILLIGGGHHGRR